MALLSSENLQIAKWLREAADLIEQQGASSFRVSAYRRAADQVMRLERGLEDTMESEGLPGLLALPGNGHGIGWAIAEMLETGRWSMLARLRGSVEPEQLFRTLPGIGPELAKNIHDTLDVDTLEALEVAVFDGRIESVPGIGRRRAEALRADLDARLAQRLRRRRAATLESPGVGMLLDVDREYREQAAAGPSRHGASIPRTGPGCRSSTPCVAAGTSRLFIPTRPAPTDSAATRTGWCSTSTATINRKASTRSLRKPGVPCGAGVWCVVGKRSTVRTTRRWDHCPRETSASGFEPGAGLDSRAQLTWLPPSVLAWYIA